MDTTIFVLITVLHPHKKFKSGNVSLIRAVLTKLQVGLQLLQIDEITVSCCSVDLPDRGG